MEALLNITQEDQELAIKSIKQIQRIDLKDKGNFTEIKVEKDGSFFRIPKKAYHLLVYILNNMAEGKSVALVPSDTQISTQQAADVLNVSRPHLVKLLESGIIPFKKVGSHRRINLKDLLDYEKKQQQQRKQHLEFLVQQAQELNLGY